MNIELSVIMPAKRVERWAGMYESIKKSFSGNFELIIVSSNQLPDALKDAPEIKWIYSERAPMQKQQIGLCHAEGKYITVVSDDSVFLPGTLDKSIELARSVINDELNCYKRIIVLKYLEGKEIEFPKWYLDQVPDDMKFKTNHDFMRADKYYYSDTHISSAMGGIPHHSPILSCALYSRKLLLEIGGWDCRFQSQAMGNVDLSARVMKHGCDFLIQDLVVSSCGYMEEATGDHGPIHYAQLEDDQPLLDRMYKNPQDTATRTVIDLENWKKSPERWWRRMKPDLTVICPGIRTKNWKTLWDSIAKTFSGSAEIIFISPYELPEELRGVEGVRWINDWGTPIKCQQKGLIAARGEFITWAADDGYFLPGALDISLKKYNESPEPKKLVMGKYYEGNSTPNPEMSKDWYYILNNHNASNSKFFGRNYYMLNVGLVPRELLLEIGGWDCQFEVCPMAYNDCAIRLQNYGVQFIIQDEMMFTCSHMPGHEGDHGPIHDAQVLHDEPLFQKIYRESRKASDSRQKIDINNYGACAEKWERRFGK